MLEYLLFKNSNVLKLQLKELCKIAHYYDLHAHSQNGREAVGGGAVYTILYVFFVKFLLRP